MFEKEALKELYDTMPVQWKIQNNFSNDTKAMCVAYIDARDVMDRLDKVVWQDCWKSDFRQEWSNTICTISIKIDWEWVGKSDTWSSGNGTEKEKSLMSDAFKRAAIHRGIWRFLYDMEKKIIKVKVEKDWNRKKTTPLDDQWNQIWDLTKYINENTNNTSKNAEAWTGAKWTDWSGDTEKATSAQVDFLTKMFKKHHISDEVRDAFIKNKFKVESMSDIPRHRISKLLDEMKSNDEFAKQFWLSQTSDSNSPSQ